MIAYLMKVEKKLFSDILFFVSTTANKIVSSPVFAYTSLLAQMVFSRRDWSVFYYCAVLTSQFFNI